MVSRSAHPRARAKGRSAAAVTPSLVLILALVAIAFPASAETPTSSISGAILGPDGAGLPGSLVVLTHAGTSRSRLVVGGEHGVFRAAGLGAGRYLARVEAAGFTTKTIPPFDLVEGESKELTVTLALAPLRRSVTVLGDGPRDSVEASEIRESPARDVGDALSSTPGVWKLRKGGIANEVVVRGYQSKDLNVLIDGQRIYGACPGHMDPPAFHADFAEVDRIEIGKGPFDVKNQGSLGGVVNIVTKRPEEGWKATANLAAGSAGYLNPSATLSFGGPLVSAQAGLAYRSSDAYRDGSGRRISQLTNYKAENVDATAFRAGTAWGKLGLTPAEGHSLELAWTHQEADQVFYPALQMDGTWDRSDRLNVTYAGPAAGSVLTAFKAQAYYTRVNHWMTDEYRTSAGMAPSGYSMGNLASSRTVGGKLEVSLGSEITAGAEVFERFWETVNQMSMMGTYTTSYAIPGATTSIAGLYAEWKHPLSATVSLGAGVRLDRAVSEADPAKASTDLYYAYNNTRSTTRTDVFPSGNVRLFYRPTEGVEISGGVGSNVRVPEPNERYYGVKRTGSDWVGNPDLAPSRNTGLDVAFSYRRSGLFAALNLFANSVADYVAVHDQTRVNTAAGVMNSTARSYSNVDAVLVGGEMNAGAAIAGRLFLSGDLSYVRGSQDAAPEKGITSTNLAEMPPLRARAGLRYDIGTLWVEAEGVFSAAQTRIDAALKESPTAGWGIANLKAGTSIAGVALTVGIGNLFDRLYFETLSYQRDPFRTGVKLPEPGRNVFANVGWRF